MRWSVTFAVTGLLFAALAPAARAGDRIGAPWAPSPPHHRHESQRCRTRVIPGHYETRTERVRVPGRWVYEEQHVHVPGRWETRYEEVTVPGFYRDVERRVWVPGRWVEERGCTGDGAIVFEAGRRVRVRVGTVGSARRWEPGHYEIVHEREWVPPRRERRPVRRWIPPTTRTHRVKVWKPATYETRTVRVWVPERVITVCEGALRCAAHLEPAPARPGRRLRARHRIRLVRAGRLGR